MSIEELLIELETATEGNGKLDRMLGQLLFGDIVQWCEFTRSVDDAITLVPENYWWTIDQIGFPNHRNQFVAEVWTVKLDPLEKIRKWGAHSTPAMALCIACLKVRST